MSDKSDFNSHLTPPHARSSVAFLHHFFTVGKGADWEERVAPFSSKQKHIIGGNALQSWVPTTYKCASLYTPTPLSSSLPPHHKTISSEDFPSDQAMAPCLHHSDFYCFIIN